MISGKRQGNVVTIYVDPANNNPIPIKSFEDTPEHAFPMTLSYQDVKAQYGDNIRLFEKPKTRIEDKAQVSDAEVKAAFENAPMGSSKPPSKSPSPKKVAPGLENELRDWMRRMRAARGKEKTQLKRDLEAIISFLVNAEPTYIEVVKELKNEELTDKKRVSLEDL